MKFRRIKTRQDELSETFYENPEWQEGHIFHSFDWNGNPENGICYAINAMSGRLHSWEAIERIED